MVETKKQKNKIKRVMKEFKRGDLHSSSKMGPLVTKPSQAKAIAMSEAGISKTPKGHGKELARKVGKRIADKSRKSAMYM